METSNNLAAVRCEADAASPSSGACAVTCSSRSSLMPALEAVRGSIAKSASLVLPTAGEEWVSKRHDYRSLLLGHVWLHPRQVCICIAACR